MPASMGDLNELRHLVWDDGQLTGSIPPELGNLNNLKTLRLQNNQLTGSIPAELGNINLMSLRLKKKPTYRRSSIGNMGDNFSI